MDKETLIQCASSGIWESLRDGVFEERLIDLKDVTKEIKTDMLVTAGEMLIGKRLAAEYVKNLIGFVNSHKGKKPSDKKADSFR